MALKQIDKRVEEAMTAAQIPGLGLAAVQRDNILFAKGYGRANLEHDIPTTADSVFEIASITKLFTATAVMRLVEDGRVSLDDPISQHVPALPAAWQAITVRHTLTHQSGLKDYTATEQYWPTTRLDISREELLGFVAHLPLQFEPGQRYHYDNTGYYLLGYLIEAVSQMTYGEFLTAEIFRPLGMAHTRVNDPYAIVPQRVAGYSLDEAGKLRHKPYYSTTGTFSAGVLLSSAADLARFAASLYTNTVLQAESRKLMWTPHPSAEGNERKLSFSVGLGWFFVDHPQGRFAGHNGGIVGFATSFVHLLERQLTVIVLCNQDKVAEPHAIALAVAEQIEEGS